MNYLEKELKDLLQKDLGIFKFIQNSSLDGLWYWDLENPENEWMDEKFWQTLGYDPDQMPHKASAWQDLIFEEDLKLTIENFNKHCADPDIPYDQLVRYRHKTGKTIWVRCRGMVIRDETGKPIRMLGAHTDLTDLKNQEEILEQCNTAASIGHWKINFTENKVLWGKITRQILEVDEDYVPELEDALSFFSNEESKTQIQHANKIAMENGLPYEIELPMLTAKGKRRWVKIIGIPEISAGKCIGIYGSVQDIHKHKTHELNLAEEKEKLKNVIKGTNVGTWEWNVQTGETVFNERWANIIGYTLEELQPISIKTWEKFTHPDDLVKSGNSLQKCFEGKVDYYHCECRMRHKEGHWVWVLDRGKIFSWTKDGSPLMMFGTHQDISKTKNISEQQHLFIKHAPAALAMFDTDLKYLSASQKWMQDFNIKEEKLLHSLLTDTFPEAKEKMEEIRSFCLIGDKHQEEEFRFIRNNKAHWLKWEANPWIDADGKVGGFIMSAENITFQKETEEKLRVSEDSFRENFDNSAIGMALVSADGSWLKVNQKLCNTLGYEAKELKKLTFQDITYPDDLEADVSLYEEVLRGERDSYQMEKRYFHKNGDIIYAILTVSVIRDLSGNLLYFISQIIDITELKKAEQRIQSLLATTQEQNSRLQNFAHIVSHNLKSHSGNIDFMIDIIGNENHSLRDLEAYRLLKHASKNLIETIEHLNEVALINTSVHDNLEYLPLYQSIEKAIGSVSALALDANVNIINTVDRDVEVLGLQAYLDSIILNFLTNGIKYRSQGDSDYVKISCSWDGSYTVLIFEDNGLGIDLERNGEELFGMYRTFHKHPESRGIGLFITKSQVEALGGKIEVESTINKGSTFKIFLQHEKSKQSLHH
ncbi:PAS domain-containing protein [Echinicola sediminis]